MSRFGFDLSELLERLKETPSDLLESETMEFKSYRDEKALHNAKELAEELSAFANHEGGTVVIGVKDSSNVDNGQWHQQLHGFPPVDLTELKERIKGRLKPNIDINIESFKYENKHYVAIEIEKSHETLVSTSGGKVCVRDGRSSRPMSPMEIEQAVKSLAPFDWSADALSLESMGIIDEKSLNQAISAYCIQKKYKEKISAVSYLEAIGATSNGRLSKGGLLFLGKESAIRENIDVLEYRFSWKKKNGELVINDIWNGNIWNAVMRAKRNFRDCNTIQKFRSGETEFDAPLMDDIAFHEAFLNALVHRDYMAEGIVSVVYTGEQLKIRSPGGFYGEITSDNIAYHEPCHRNKNLARILMTHNLVDRAGMGVLRMGLGSLRYGRAFPEFREHSDAIEVIMEAEYLRPGIAVLWIENPEWGVPELLALNSVYEKGFVTVSDLEASGSVLTLGAHG
ncbi:MAG: RNA-binding domain-containing protein [Geminicoccaceae bacterium]